MYKSTPKRHFLSFNRKLFLSVISIFFIFIITFLAYQYQREKEFKIEMLEVQLQNYNNTLYEKLKQHPLSDELIRESLYNHLKDIRVTIVDLKGKVIFDSFRKDYNLLGNHFYRPEIQEALKYGYGFDVRRTSESTGLNYFYAATAYDSCIIRSALPYNVPLINTLKADSNYLWFTGILTLILVALFYKFTHKLGKSINNLREFAMRADRNESIEMNALTDFPHNELGEISQHIIQIYKRLHKTKEALYIEREKLIAHLQTSREGLGIFTKDKKEILVNNLFTQYSNLISDSNLQETEEVFAVKEFQEITDFISKGQAQLPKGREEKRMSISIDKNGRTFAVECILFQDSNFEISINDVTLEEERVRLKRQLTQNIAHELKTPVSSIQGYLETIVNNKNIPPEKLHTFLDRCYAQSNRLSHLLQDISVLTRMDEASNLIGMETLNLSVIVKNIINEVYLDLDEKQITVVNSLKDNLMMRGNYSLIYSIFRNLMDNAIAYAGNNIQIHISCFREDSNYYYFSFADNGVGVAPEHLNRLFERFYRVDKGRSRKLGGTGLGLAIVKNAVLIHGGSISAKNYQQNGLEFIFTLAKGK